MNWLMSLRSSPPCAGTRSSCSLPPRSVRPGASLWVWGLAAGVLLTAGCRMSEELETTYGQRRGAAAGPSVNGTAGLAEMFRQAGHRVTTWKRLSPRLEDAQVIVWAPDNVLPPGPEARAFLETWLARQPGRTLVYIGRDYDAESAYWQAVLPAAPPDQAFEIQRRLALAQARHDARCVQLSDGGDFDWFALEDDQRPRRVQDLSGPWARDIDVRHTALHVRFGYRPAADQAELTGEDSAALWPTTDPVPATHSSAESPNSSGSSTPAAPSPEETAAATGPPGGLQFRPLLASGEDLLALEIRSEFWEDSQLLVLANGSFVLNYGLLPREHRKLAQRLVTACGPSGRVVFLESGPEDPLILDREMDAEYLTGLEALTVYPLGTILMHFTALGLLACFAFFPIFGRPRGDEDSERPTSGSLRPAAAPRTTLRDRTERAEFAQHIEALADLLERTHDESYARSRWQYYHQQQAEPKAGPAARP